MIKEFIYNWIEAQRRFLHPTPQHYDWEKQQAYEQGWLDCIDSLEQDLKEHEEYIKEINKIFDSE